MDEAAAILDLTRAVGSLTASTASLEKWLSSLDTTVTAKLETHDRNVREGITGLSAKLDAVQKDLGARCDKLETMRTEISGAVKFTSWLWAIIKQGGPVAACAFLLIVDLLK